ncbi:MAG TPA: HAD family hydrolase [Candidatus Limnocylindrales bacterium]
MPTDLRVGGVVFDWDGTLADSLALFFRANAAVMAGLGVPFDELAYRHHYTPDWRVAYRRLGVPEERLEEAGRHWRDVFDARSGETRPLPGAVEAVERLAARGLSVGVVTAGDRRVVEPQITAFGLGPLLGACVYGDDLEAVKPDPAPLRRALELLGRANEPGDTAYVGDAPDDMRMAMAVGCPAIGIESMLGEAPALREAGAVAVFPSVATWVEAWLGPDEPASTR